MDKAIEAKKQGRTVAATFARYRTLIGRDSHVDWAIIFAASCVIGIACVGWGIFRFFELGSQEVAEAPTQESAQAINPAQFVDLSKEFEAKRLKTQELESGSSVYTPDPSVI